MKRCNETPQLLPATAHPQEYEAPVLTVIGDASQVILGVPGGGDDYFGFTIWEFEFEPDSDETAPGL